MYPIIQRVQECLRRANSSKASNDVTFEQVTELFMKKLDEASRDNSMPESLNNILIKLPMDYVMKFYVEEENVVQNPSIIEIIEMRITSLSWTFSRPWGIDTVPESPEEKMIKLIQYFYQSSSVANPRRSKVFFPLIDCFGVYIPSMVYTINIKDLSIESPPRDVFQISLRGEYYKKLIWLDHDSLSYRVTPLIDYDPLECEWQYKDLFNYFFEPDSLEIDWKNRALLPVENEGELVEQELIKNREESLPSAIRSVWRFSRITPHKSLPIIGTNRLVNVLITYIFDTMDATFILSNNNTRVTIKLNNTSDGPRIYDAFDEEM